MNGSFCCMNGHMEVSLLSEQETVSFRRVFHERWA